MRIDAHQHFWRYDASEYGWIDDSMAVLRRDFLPADAHAGMARAGFDACVAVQARQTLEETRWLLALADAHPFIAGVVGWVDLQAPTMCGRSSNRLRPTRSWSAFGTSCRASLTTDFCCGPRSAAASSLLDEFGLAYDLLIYSRHLPVATEFVARFAAAAVRARSPCEAGHPSGETRGVGARSARAGRACPMCGAKLSGLVTEADWRRWTPDQIRPYLDVAFDCFGAERLMIGSDWPVCTVAADYGRTMAAGDGLRCEVGRRPNATPCSAATRERFWKLQVPVTYA